MAYWASSYGEGSVNPLGAPQTQAVYAGAASHAGASSEFAACEQGAGSITWSTHLRRKRVCREGLVWASVCGWWWGSWLSGRLGAVVCVKSGESCVEFGPSWD